MQYTTSSRAWHSGCIEAECASELYARYLCSRDALGQARRATIGYLVYKRASKGILHITSMIKSKDGQIAYIHFCKMPFCCTSTSYKYSNFYSQHWSE